MIPVPLKQFDITARQFAPRKGKKNTEVARKLFRHTVFAKTLVEARSRFWVALRRVAKLKPTCAEIVGERVVDDFSVDRVRNFAFHVHYTRKRKGYDAYKEFRALSCAEAAHLLFADLRGNHGVPREHVWIVSHKELLDDQLQKPAVKRFVEEGLELAHPNLLRPTIRKTDRRVFVRADQVPKAY